MYTQWFARQRALQIVFIAWRGQQQLMDSTAAQLDVRLWALSTFTCQDLVHHLATESRYDGYEPIPAPSRTQISHRNFQHVSTSFQLMLTASHIYIK
jgi:hypothetical protein